MLVELVAVLVELDVVLLPPPSQSCVQVLVVLELLVVELVVPELVVVELVVVVLLHDAWCSTRSRNRSW